MLLSILSYLFLFRSYPIISPTFPLLSASFSPAFDIHVLPHGSHGTSLLDFASVSHERCTIFPKRCPDVFLHSLHDERLWPLNIFLSSCISDIQICPSLAPAAEGLSTYPRYRIYVCLLLYTFLHNRYRVLSLRTPPQIADAGFEPTISAKETDVMPFH